MVLKDEILSKAFEIGFNYEKMSYREKASVSFPCAIYLKNGEFYECAIIIVNERPKEVSNHLILEIEAVDKIASSEYALSLDHRMASINAEEFRNDWPFFLRTKNNKILGYNAYQPINFTYKKEIKAKDIIATVDFPTARKEGFEFVKSDLGEIPFVYCGYDEELIGKVKTNA